jgi:RNA polymerase sigma factor (TIGR02999 family)
MTDSDDITVLLKRFQDGDADAGTQLIHAVQDELREMAARFMRRENKGHTLQTTALVNEAYLKLINAKKAGWRDRAHFFAVAARIMRHILVDHARRHVAGKRGGGVDMLPINEGLVYAEERSDDMVRLDAALERLSASDERAGRVVELRFSGGLSVEECAEVMHISPRTVKREWMYARAWLRTELEQD